MLGPSGMKLRPLPPLSSLLQVLGLDVMLDDAAAPRLLEINSNPSLAVDMEARETGGGRTESASERESESERRTFSLLDAAVARPPPVSPSGRRPTPTAPAARSRRRAPSTSPSSSAC